MNDQLVEKIRVTYVSTATQGQPGVEEAVDPATIGMIWSFVQTLLTGCRAPQAQRMMQRPAFSGARRRIRNYLDAHQQMTGENFDKARVAQTIEKLGAGATVEEFESAIRSAGADQ